MSIEEIEIGDIVISKMGHDKGLLYLVIGKEKDNYFVISDGKKHPIEKTKIKNAKHLKIITRSNKIPFATPSNKEITQLLSKIKKTEKK